MKKKRSMLTKISLAILLAGGTLAGTAFADTTFTPTHVGCIDNGHCFILVSPAVPSGISGCATNLSQVRWLLSSPGGTEMFRTALSAQLAGRNLEINFYTSSCVDGFPQANYLFPD